MTRILHYGAVVLTLVIALAQSNHLSAAPPYAANGFGLQVRDDAGRSRGMGGAGGSDADGYNLLRGNPALNSGVTRFTFSFGAAYNRGNTAIDSAESESWGKTDAELLSLTIPLPGTFVLGWGLAPLTRTDVQLYRDSVQDGQSIHDETDMTGGINISTMSIAGTFKDVIRFGYSLNYNFGAIQEGCLRTFPADSSLNASAYYLKRKYQGYSHSAGIIFEMGKWVTAGFGYTTQASLDKTTEVVLTNITNDPTVLGDGSAKYPASWRFSLYTHPNERLSGGVDISRELWEDAAETTAEQAFYSDSYSIGAGIRYVPSSRQSDPFYMKLPLTVGFRTGTLYYKSYPVVDVVKEHAVTFGVEFPLRNNSGSVFTTFDAGIRGDKSTNGWQDVFTGFSIVLIGKIL